MEQKTGKLKTLWQLFSNMFLISSFTFGGGFVIVNFMKRRFVDELHWIDENEMMDMVSLGQSSPGAIAVNAANLLGWRMAGFPGMLAAVLGTALPPMLILLVISTFYNAFAQNRYVAFALRGMQAGVAAIIMDVACNLLGKLFKDGSILRIGLMAAAFAATFFFGVNPAILLGIAILIGVGVTFFGKEAGPSAS